jgi:hypothetical protein
MQEFHKNCIEISHESIHFQKNVGIGENPCSKGALKVHLDPFNLKELESTLCITLFALEFGTLEFFKI